MKLYKILKTIKIGATAMGAFAIGAAAVGAYAIGSAAIGRLYIGKSSFGRLSIRELSIKKLRTGETGRRVWVIPEGYIPAESTGPQPQMLSHETACILNVNDKDASVEILIFFSDKEPVGPYRINVPARRTSHVRFNDLKDPEPVPLDTDYSSLIKSDIPIIVQHTRLDSRQAENALLSTIAYPAE